MSVDIALEELLRYSDYERARWREWFIADPSRLAIPFQTGARFPTVGSLVHHIFWVERRHLSRLEGVTPPETIGVADDDVAALFRYGDEVRADLRAYLARLGDPSEVMTLNLSIGTFNLTRRKLAVHIVLHEIRHFAQVAYAVRVAGAEPPGNHDLLFFPELA